MTSDMRFFKAIKEEFAQHFTSPRLRLPEEDFRDRKRGKMPWGSGMVFYTFVKEDGREYLEYFRYHHMGEGHARIYDDGTIVQLLTLTDDWFEYNPSLPGTAEEQQAAWDELERRTVEDILAKDLYDDEWHPQTRGMRATSPLPEEDGEGKESSGSRFPSLRVEPRRAS